MQTVLDLDGMTCIYRHIRFPITTTPKKILTQVLQRPCDRFVASNLYNRKEGRLAINDTRINTIAIPLAISSIKSGGLRSLKDDFFNTDSGPVQSPIQQGF